MDYQPEYVDITDVPSQRKERANSWLARFNAIPEGKAVILQYNTRQRAHQVATNLRMSARYYKIPICTRTIHGTPEIHGTSDYLLYFWKKNEEKDALS